jgi:ABC-type antimicrobial peptide transport system permease subunit
LIDINQPEGSGATASPTFIWTATGKAYEVVGVFNTTIYVTGKNIDNTNNCIAMWTTGMSGSAGNVPFSNFKQVVNGNLTSNSTNNLNNGTYHWAVWAYDDTETVVSSSADITFTAP